MCQENQYQHEYLCPGSSLIELGLLRPRYGSSKLPHAVQSDPRRLWHQYLRSWLSLVGTSWLTATSIWSLLRHTFCPLCWVNTIVLISLISLFLRYIMTLFLISCRHLSIVFYLSLVWLYSLLRCITLTHINLLWSWSYVSHALFLFPTLSDFILHAFIPYLNRIPRCYILLQLVWNQPR